MPHLTGCSACCPPIAGMRTRDVRSYGIWGMLGGCWWWTRPASSRKGRVGGSAAAVQRHGGADRKLSDRGISALAPRTLLDRELYLPQVWAEDWERRRSSGRCFLSDQAPVSPGDAGGRWKREFPLPGLLGMRSTAATAACGCGWSRKGCPTCWSRATGSCGSGRERAPAR